MPKQLGSNFLANLDVKNFPDAPNVAAKFEFIKLLASRGMQPDDVAELWHLLYPDDDNWWNREEVRRLLSKAATRSVTK